MVRIVKAIIFAGLLIMASLLFGSVCVRVSQGYKLISSPFKDELFSLALWLTLALGAMTLTAGLIAVLLRPLWVCFIAFAFSALAMLTAWELKTGPGLLVFVYFVASLLYTQGIAGELKERLNFSVRPIAESQAILLLVLIAIACAAFYFGYAAQIEREGFSIPANVRHMVMEIAIGPMESRIEERTDLEPRDKEAMLAEIRKGFEQEFMKPMESKIKQYEKLVPLAVAVSLFMSLATAARFFSWVPILVLRLVFSLLTAFGVTKVITEMREARRLVI